jgi:hypothetical protein
MFSRSLLILLTNLVHLGDLLIKTSLFSKQIYPSSSSPFISFKISEEKRVLNIANNSLKVLFPGVLGKGHGRHPN